MPFIVVFPIDLHLALIVCPCQPIRPKDTATSLVRAAKTASIFRRKDLPSLSFSCYRYAGRRIHWEDTIAEAIVKAVMPIDSLSFFDGIVEELSSCMLFWIRSMEVCFVEGHIVTVVEHRWVLAGHLSEEKEAQRGEEQ